jgi:hypothetical protein
VRHRSLVMLALLCGWSTMANAGRRELKRVDQFPAGEQVNSLIGSFLGGLADWSKEEFTFDAPFSSVWDATKGVAYEINNMGGQPVTGTDAAAGRIHIGKVSQDQFFGMGPGTWVDEIAIELKRDSESTTTVKVMRKVVAKEVTGDRKIRTQKSNGKVERFILTRIADVLAGKESASGGADGDGPAGRYVSSRNDSDNLVLRRDGTCLAQQWGISLPCRYEVRGSDVLVTYQAGQQEKMGWDGEALKDLSGTVWQRPGTAKAPSSPPAATITNDDITRMAGAGLPDSVILGRIRGARCRFDLSTDALIKLKAAGVSDAVLEAMTTKR